MEGTSRVDIWAGIAMFVLCLVIGAIEGATVLASGSWPFFVPWLAAFLTFLVGIVVTAGHGTPATTRGRLLLVAVPVLGASAVVLLSPNRGGLSLILLVLTAAIASRHLTIREIVGAIAWNSTVVLAAGAALGPLIDEPNPPVELLLTAFLYTLLQAASAAMVWTGHRMEKALRDLSVAHVELRSTSALLAESSQAQERLRISRELHDVLGHQLTALALELEISSHQVTGEARAHVLRSRGIAKDLLAGVRDVVGTERSRSFDLRSALASIVDDVPQPGAHLQIDPGLDVPDDHAVILVRAVQEITTNAIRHSSAENLWFRISQDEGSVRLEARDDGVGARDVVAGNGLRGLTERVAALGGTVALDGSDGFRVRAELPTHQAVPA